MGREGQHDDFVVVMDVAGTQAFIAASSRLREIVGASQLVREIAEPLADDRGVTVLSSRTNVIVATSASRMDARSFVTEVSRRAARSAPGLVLRAGLVDGFADDPGGAVTRCFRVLSAPAAAHDQPSERAWFKPCASGSGVASRRLLFGADQPEERFLGTIAALKADAASRARARWADEFPGVFDITLDALDTYLDGGGWIGVIHLDLNGLGLALNRVLDSADDYRTAYRSFSEHVYSTVTGAISGAVEDLDVPTGSPSNAVVPLVLAGDDVTVVCPAAAALPLLEGVFTRLTSLQTGRPVGTPFLGASAGIAYVRRTHPMHHAIELAHDLTDAAKSVRARCDGTWHHAFDLEVVHDSVLEPLSALRARRVDGGGHPLSGGPYVVATGHDVGLVPRWIRAHHVEHLHAWRAAFTGKAALSGAAAHRLREVASQSLFAAAAEYGLMQRSGPPFFRDSDADSGDGTAMLDALALSGVTR